MFSGISDVKRLSTFTGATAWAPSQCDISASPESTQPGRSSHTQKRNCEISIANESRPCNGVREISACCANMFVCTDLTVNNVVRVNEHLGFTVRQRYEWEFPTRSRKDWRRHYSVGASWCLLMVSWRERFARFRWRSEARHLRPIALCRIRTDRSNSRRKHTF